MERKIDGMLLGTFLSTVFFSATYPYIHKEIIANVSDSVIALNQIINCLSIVILGSLWNKKSDMLFEHYSAFCIWESVINILLTLWATITNDLLVYYIMDTVIFAIVTRNILCGGTKLRAIRYQTETEREHFDNNDNSARAVATIIGSIIAMILNLDFSIMLWLATFGNTIDNVFYLFIYNNTKKKDFLSGGMRNV